VIAAPEQTKWNERLLEGGKAAAFERELSGVK
jgi:hypothetical protein